MKYLILFLLLISINSKGQTITLTTYVKQIYSNNLILLDIQGIYTKFTFDFKNQILIIQQNNIKQRYTFKIIYIQNNEYYYINKNVYLWFDPTGIILYNNYIEKYQY